MHSNIPSQSLFLVPIVRLQSMAVAGKPRAVDMIGKESSSQSVYVSHADNVLFLGIILSSL
jgi:hypothetical protein